MFKRINDLVTGNSVNFSKENDSYSEAISECDAMYDLSKLLFNDPKALDYTFRVHGQNIDIHSFRYMVDRSKKNLSSSDIRKLEIEYQACCEELQNIFLQLEEWDEIQEHTAKLNRIIYQNASYEAYQPFVSSKLPTKKWTLEEMEKLKKLIAIRRQVIIPYLGRLR